MKKNTPTSDPIYKRLYSFAEMVADLLRSILPAEMLEAVDLRSLEKVSAAYVGDDFRQRRGDTVWRVRAAGTEGGWAYMLVLLEFQASSDATMALRMIEYTAMLERELLRAGVAEPGDLPPVLPVVLYNGESRWTAAGDANDLIAPTGEFLSRFQPWHRYLLLDLRRAKADYAGKLTTAVARLEQSTTPDDLAKVAGLLAAELVGPGHEEPSAGEREGLAPRLEEPSAGEREGLAPRLEELRRAFVDWLWVLYERMRGVAEPSPTPPGLTLEEMKMMLEERVALWPEKWRLEGKREGIELGKEQGIELGKEQGIELGERRGRREQLRRLTEVRFGVPTAEQLSALLRREDDLQRLDALAEAVVRCETADELLRQAAPNGSAANPSA